MSTGKQVPEAQPQTREQLQGAPRCPEVAEAAIERGITSIVHFTTVSGLLGILASGAVKNRQDLPVDELVQYVYEPNAVDRHLDRRWHAYVNLSVTAINLRMYNYQAAEIRCLWLFGCVRAGLGVPVGGSGGLCRPGWGAF